jgi:stage II sporulation protein D
MLRLFIILIISFYSLTLSAFEMPVVSVRIGKSLRNIIVSGLDLKRHLVFSNDTRNYSGRKTVKFNCETYTSLNKVRNKPVLLATLESPSGLLSFEQEKYLGQFKVITSKKGDSCDIINEIPMESYISSLLTKEMNSKWPLEALKAQAVAARTYAYHKMKTQQVTKELGSEAFYDLESSEKHQVAGNFFDATESTNRASQETEGQVLTTHDGKLNPIFFNAKCGGRTLRPDQVWHNREEGYQSVNCPFCQDVGPKGWSNILGKERLVSFFEWAYEKKYIKEKIDEKFNSFVLVPDNIDRFTLNFYINDKPFIVEKSLFRNYFGRFLFPSNTFAVKRSKRGLLIEGEGMGHGVGLCQMGALVMAKRGWSYKKILSHYFPNHVLKKLY